jgi:hypothetical protein
LPETQTESFLPVVVVVVPLLHWASFWQETSQVGTGVPDLLQTARKLLV